MITELYDFFNNLHLRINSKDRQRRYKNMQPVPYLVLDNFLPEAVLQQVAKEAAEIPAHFWNEFTRGGLELWNLDKSSVNTTIDTLPNRLLIWDHDENLIHGYPEPINCPEGQYRTNLRMFYYTSNSVPEHTPHPSLGVRL